MRFLDRNQYCIYYSQRCNYGCSYCINQSSVDAPESEVEKNTELVLELLQNIEPGVIMVSGGEPILWYGISNLIYNTDHYWVILSNLSYLPDWIFHDRVKLVIAAYHEQFTDIEVFTKRLKRLKRAIVKILVVPGQEKKHLGLHKSLWMQDIPTHLAPVEWPRGFDESFLYQLRTNPDLRTSCLYNSRFFSCGVEAPRLCIAGTNQMFQINPGGNIGRCSQAGAVHNASIFNRQFSDIPQMCTRSCYCEWHHWAGMTLAEDNEVWNRYIDTGTWIKPSREELESFVVKMGWSLWSS